MKHSFHLALFTMGSNAVNRDIQAETISLLLSVDVIKKFSHFTIRLGFKTFLRASAMLKHVIAIGLTSVRLSVRPSVRHTLAPYQNG